MVSPKDASSKMKIELDTVQAFFRSNEERGVSMGRPMMWGFFFKDSRARSLTALRRSLEGRGYAYVDTLGPEEGTLWLYMSIVEKLSADVLFERCAELEAMSQSEFGVECDGFDVGNADGSVLIGR